MQGLRAALAGDVALDRFTQLAVALDGQETAHFRNGGNLFREMLLHLGGEIGGYSLVPTGCRRFQDISGLQVQVPPDGTESNPPAAQRLPCRVRQRQCSNTPRAPLLCPVTAWPKQKASS